MIRRFLFVVFFWIGGIVFYIPKWIIMGTKASRERKKMRKLLAKQTKLLEQQQRQSSGSVK